MRATHDCHPREGGDPKFILIKDNFPLRTLNSWIPAFAGMTIVGSTPCFVKLFVNRNLFIRL